jgi:predicted phage replisome organizer
MQHIKSSIYFFEDDKLKAIRSHKDGDTVILMYIMLITVAVKSDAGGHLMLCEGIPYDDKILSSILNLPLSVVKSGLEMLVKFGLLTVTDSAYLLTGYDEYADIKTAKERRQNAERQARFKAKNDTTAVTVTERTPTKNTDARGDS